jgi:hypothetical protein
VRIRKEFSASLGEDKNVPSAKLSEMVWRQERVTQECVEENGILVWSGGHIGRHNGHVRDGWRAGLSKKIAWGA